MFEIDHPEVDAEAVLTRVRAINERAGRAPPPAPVSELPRSSAVDRAALEGHLETARRTWMVGERLPPMTRRVGLIRRFVEPAARVVLRVAQLITRDQRQFNAAVLGALVELRAAVEEQRGELAALRVEVARAGGDARAAKGAAAELSAKMERQASALASLQAEVARAGGDAHAAKGAAAELSAKVDQLAAGLSGLEQRFAGAAQAAELSAKVERQASALASLEQRLAGAVQESAQARALAAQHDHSLASLLERAAGERRGAAPVLEAVAAHVGQARDRSYSDLEGRFRGTREEIKARATVYLPLLREAGLGTADAPVLDLGCGRGEWLELLKEHGLHARGIDSNAETVEACAKLGLSVERADVMEALRKVPEQSLGAVSAIHVVEHLSPAQIHAFVGEAVRVLRPGGMLLLETPNPRNLVVGACTFYLDPTHVRPVHPDWLSLTLEGFGLQRVKLLLAQPDPRYRTPPPEDPLLAAVNEMLFGPRDYAAIGYRP